MAFKGNLRLRATKWAEQEARRKVKEQPPGSNWGPRVAQYLHSAGWSSPAPWCMAFMHWCFRQAGKVLIYPYPASVGFFENWANKNGYLVNRPLRGDLVCYRFDADNWPDHVGIVSRVLAVRWRGGRFVGWVKTVEGNTSYGNDANGGRVMYRYRWMNARTRFVRIPGEPGE